MNSYGSANATPGYAKMSQYGSQGTNPIVPPTPATLNPSVLAFMKPHSVASMMATPGKQTASNTGYVSLGKLCNK